MVLEARGTLGNQRLPSSRCILGLPVGRLVLHVREFPAVLEVLGNPVFLEYPENLSVLNLQLLPDHPFLQLDPDYPRFQGNQSHQEVPRIRGNQVPPFGL